MSNNKSSSSSSSEKTKPSNINYSNIRILQKNIVYVIGLSSSLADKQILFQPNFFGQYGNILKIVVNKNGYNQNFQGETTYSAYITYSSQEEASLALLAIDNCVIDGHVIRGSFGTTKYCTFFLQGIECSNKECLYLHEWAKDEDCIFKEDINGNKHIFYQQQKIAMQIADIFNPEKKRIILSKKKFLGDLYEGEEIGGMPGIETIYNKHIVKDFLKKERKYSYNSPNTYGNSNNKKYQYSSSGYNSGSGGYNSGGNNNNDYDFGNINSDEEMEYVLVREPNKKKRKWKHNNNNNNNNNIHSNLVNIHNLSNYNPLTNFCTPTKEFSGNITSYKNKPKYNIEDFKKRLLPQIHQVDSPPYPLVNENKNNCSKEVDIIKQNSNSSLNSLTNINTNNNSNSLQISLSHSSSTSSSSNNNTNSIKNERFNSLYKKPNKSRFDFVNGEDDTKEKIYVPDFICDLLYKGLSSYSFYNTIGGFKDELVMNDEVDKICKWNNNNTNLINNNLNNSSNNVGRN